jgi:hypothetical protein
MMNLVQAITVEQWSAELLLVVWGIAQSLILEYVPYVAPWYAKLDKKWKRLTQALALFVISAIVILLGCYDVIGGVACDQNGIVAFLWVWILALIANQTTHLVVKKDGPQ